MRVRAVVGFLLMAFALLVVPLVLPPDGNEHEAMLQFVGRFHPLIVHLPVALLLLVPVFEIAGRFQRWTYLREAARIVLWFGAISAVAAVALGYVLAYSGGYSGEVLEQHLWGGIGLTLGSLLCLLLRSLGGWLRWCYAVLLLAMVGALLWTSHLGGVLTHGETFLTQHMPEGLRTLLGVASIDASAADTVFAGRIAPILDSNCVACHGAAKSKGRLRLNSYTALLKGGESGVVVVPGKPDESDLLRRISLPPGDREAMPAEGKPPLSKEQIALIRWWIQEGASAEGKIAEVKKVPDEIKAFFVVDTGPVVPDYSKFKADILHLQQELGVKIVPVSQKAGDGLILRTINAASHFGDAALAKLSTIARFIVEAELGGTQVSDAGLVHLKAFANVRRLHLERTGVSGTGLSHVVSLSHLEYLNLCNTLVQDEALASLSSMASLRKLYLFESKVTASGVEALQKALPECQIVFGQ